MNLWRDVYVRIIIHWNILGDRLKNFEIRVGVDNEDVGKNPVCHEQQSSVPVGVTETFTCTVALYGNWVSVNKSSIDESDLLQLKEVRVYSVNGEYKHKCSVILTINLRLMTKPLRDVAWRCK